MSIIAEAGAGQVTMDWMQHLSVVTLLVLGAWCQAGIVMGSLNYL